MADLALSAREPGSSDCRCVRIRRAHPRPNLAIQDPPRRSHRPASSDSRSASDSRSPPRHQSPNEDRVPHHLVDINAPTLSLQQAPLASVRKSGASPSCRALRERFRRRARARTITAPTYIQCPADEPPARMPRHSPPTVAAAIDFNAAPPPRSAPPTHRTGQHWASESSHTVTTGSRSPSASCATDAQHAVLDQVRSRSKS